MVISSTWHNSIQLGSLINSSEFFNIIVPIITGFVGTIIGGIITYYASVKAEERKWKREIKYKLNEDRRKALSIVLEWFDPYKRALSKASLLSFKMETGRIEEPKYLEEFPNLLQDLLKFDPPANLRVLLSEDIYTKSFEIINGLEELKTLPLIKSNDYMFIAAKFAVLNERMKEFEIIIEREFHLTYS